MTKNAHCWPGHHHRHSMQSVKLYVKFFQQHVSICFFLVFFFLSASLSFTSPCGSSLFRSKLLRVCVCACMYLCFKNDHVSFVLIFAHFVVDFTNDMLLLLLLLQFFLCVCCCNSFYVASKSTRHIMFDLSSHSLHG